MVSVEECATILPVEIVSKILYTHGGLRHPTASIIKKYVKSSFCKDRCFCCLDKAYCGELWNNELTTINPNWIFWKLSVKQQYLINSYLPDQIHVCFCCAQ